MNDRSEARPRAWQRMLSGRRLDLLDPQPADVEIGDIAHGLSRVARWNGQTVGDHAFSVAQHALLVEHTASTLHSDWSCEFRLAALLHDAAEYVIGDLISPFKAAIGLDYKSFEVRLLSAIHRRFDLPDPLPELVSAAIKKADRITTYFEATRLAGFSHAEAETYFGPGIDPASDLHCFLDDLTALPTRRAQQQFLDRFDTLMTTR